MARGKSTTTANDVRDPTGQPDVKACISTCCKCFNPLAPSAPNGGSRQKKFLRSRKLLVYKYLWPIRCRGDKASFRLRSRVFGGLLHFATEAAEWIVAM